MREMVLPQVTNFEDKSNSCTVFERSRRRWLNVFFFSTIVGAVMGGTGLTISLLGSFHFFEGGLFFDRLDSIATALIAAFFPVIVFAAHSLDKAEEAKKAIKYKRQK